MFPAEFALAVPAGVRPQTPALDRAATDFSRKLFLNVITITDKEFGIDLSDIQPTLISNPFFGLKLLNWLRT
jgi:hypothetical protein